MIKCIWKYELPLQFGEFDINMPKGSVARAIGTDGHQKLCMWVEVDLEATLFPHRYRLLGSGEGFKERHNYHYIATTLFGEYVYHLFQETSIGLLKRSPELRKRKKDDKGKDRKKDSLHS